MENYQKITFTAEKGFREFLKAEAHRHGMNYSEYIRFLVKRESEKK